MVVARPQGYFMMGARHAIQSRGDLHIRRFSGTSAGAWTAMFMASGLSSSDWLRTYTMTATTAEYAIRQGQAPPALMEAYRERLWPWLSKALPEDAYKRCSGRLFVTISTFDGFGFLPRKRIVSEFASNDELFEACAASSCIPLVTTKSWGLRFLGEGRRGMRGFDGLFTDNVPVFTDNVRPQLVFTLSKIRYDMRDMVKANDPCIEVRSIVPNRHPSPSAPLPGRFSLRAHARSTHAG